MTKEQTVVSIEQAREKHLMQMAKIESIITGQDIDQPTAVSKTECDFGHWLYGDMSHVKILIGVQFYEQLDRKHEQWHREYSKIHDIFFKQKSKKGFFLKLLGQNQIDSLELDKAKLYYTELKETTQELLHILSSVERRLRALPEAKFHSEAPL